MNKTKAQDGTSSKEKEILKKKLEVLFKNHEKTDKSFTGHKMNPKSKIKQNPQQVKGQQIDSKNKVNANQSEALKKEPIGKISKNKKTISSDKPKNTNSNSKQQKFQVNSLNHNKAPKSLQTLHEHESPIQKKKKNKNKKPANPTGIPETLPNTQIKENAKQHVQKKHNLKAKLSSASQTLHPPAPNGQPKLSKNQKKNAKKHAATMINHQSHPPSTNDQTKMTKNQKKKAKKRAAATANLSNHQSQGKKPKLTEKVKELKHGKKPKMFQQFEKKSPNTSTSQFDDEYDINNMSGFVQGGEFNSDYEDYQDWVQAENYLNEDTDGESNKSNFDSDEEEDVDSGDMVQIYGDQERKDNMKKYDSSIGSEEDYFDSDDYGDEYSDSEEEEENCYDFDEYEEEEDEDYSMDSYDYSSNYDEDEDNEKSYDFNDDVNDDDYNLPEHVPEDLIIHGGTALKRDLKPEDNISFDSDDEETQIIELEKQKVIKVIKQPKAYDKEELLKLKYEEKTAKTVTLKTSDATTNNSTSSELEDCPKLVPIVDEDGFQLYNPNESEEEESDSDENDSMEGHEEGSMDDVSLGSEYMEINSDDEDSMLSEDINEKYLRGNDNDSDSSVDYYGTWIKEQKADVIDATGCKYEDTKDGKPKEDSDVSLNDDIKQTPSQKLFENVNLKTKGSILSTTIIDDKILKSDIEDDKESDNQINLDKEMEIVDNKSSEDNKESNHQVNPDNETEILDNITFDALDQYDSIESISSENDTSQNRTTEPANRVKTTAQNLSNYNTKFYNALDSNLVLVLLKDPFYIYGTVRLTLLAGVLDVYGHSLTLNKEVEIFSPRGCSVIEIASTPRTEITSEDNLKDILKSYEINFALADLKSISDSYEVAKDAVLLLKRNEGRKKVVQQFKKFMNENVFPNINNINMDRSLYNSEYLLRCMINTSALEQKCLQLPSQWQQLSVTQETRVMLTGGKGVGKSTLLRFLINRHLPKLKQILLIDLDIGQPEIFVPQTVSCSVITQPLLGPGFLLNLQPEKSYAVGHTNIALCAHKYLQAIRSLISYCLTEEKYKEMPWLINTMGYNKGFGLELISVIAKELPLTDVIQLQSTKGINNFDSILFSHVVSNVPRNMFIEEDFNKDDPKKMEYRLHVWQSAVQQESRYQKEWHMSAKDLRYAILLARLSEALQGQAEWLTDCKPLCAPLDQLRFINLLENTSSASQEELTKAVEANLVYLCRYEDDNKPVECLGIGVVRGIDFHVHQLYLLPAMSASLLKHVNCLAIGEMPLPNSIFTNQGSRVKNLAPFVYNTIAANASKAIKQIYHRPRKFLTGKRKSLD